MNRTHKIIKTVSKIALLAIIPGLVIIGLIMQPVLFSHTAEESSFLKDHRVSAEALQTHVKYLSEINRTTPAGQNKTADYIINELNNYGIPAENIELQNYSVQDNKFQNIIVHFKNKHAEKSKKYIIGSHYDSFNSLPGADDNASAVAGLLEISRVLNDTSDYRDRNIDLVFYSNEESPFFRTKNMGSYHHAKSVTENIELAIILEMIGYFSEKEQSQDYPVSALKYLYPEQGNFITLVSNFSNISEVRKIKSRFKSHLSRLNLINVESINAPTMVRGIDFSDHQNYWHFNIPAIMVTDTAFYRNKEYHTAHDTYEKLNYIKMKEVVDATIFSVLTL